MRAKRIDNVQQEIVNALRAEGYSVDFWGVNGAPDLVVGCRGPHGKRNVLIECKSGNEGFTPAQKRWHATWHGVAHVARSVEEALLIVREGGGLCTDSL